MLLRRLLSPRAIVGMGIGYGVAHFLDPDRGRSRRAKAKDQLMAAVRRTGRDAARQSRYVAGQAKGAVHDAMPSARPTPEGRVLADRVASEVLGDPRWKGDVNIEATEHTVVLRGQLRDAATVEELEGRVRQVPGVEAVESYLHLPGQPAPNVARAVRATATSGASGRTVG